MAEFRNAQGYTQEEFLAKKRAEKILNNKNALTTNKNGELVNAQGLTMKEYLMLRQYEDEAKKEAEKKATAHLLPSPAAQKEKVTIKSPLYGNMGASMTNPISPLAQSKTEYKALPGSDKKETIKIPTLKQNRATLGAESVEIEKPEAKGKKEFYSMPDMSVTDRETEARLAAEEAEAQLSVSEKRLTATAEKLTTLQNFLNVASSKLDYYKSEYDKNPTEENAKLHDDLLDLAIAAEEEYNSILEKSEGYTNTGKALYDDYRTKVAEYNSFGYKRTKAYNDWLSTIRSAEEVKAEAEALEKAIKELDKKTKDNAAVLGSSGANVRRATDATEFMASSQPIIGEISNNSSQKKALKEKYALVLEELEYAEELERAEYYKSLMSKPDFAEKSKYIPTGSTGKLTLSGYYDFGDIDVNYEIINGNYTIRQQNRTNNTRSGWADYSDHLNYLTDNEKAVYNYLHTVDKKTANEFIEDLEGDLNERTRKATEERWAEEAKKNPVGSSVASVFVNAMGKPRAFIGQLADMFDDGKIDENASYNSSVHISNSIRNTVSSDMNGLGSFLYMTGMSIADFATVTALTGGNELWALTLMGTGAAADTTVAAKDRGLSDAQALSLGVIAGMAEAITEKVSIEALFEAKGVGKSAIGYLCKNVFAEAEEEVSSELINTFADIIIAGDKSEWETSIKNYMEAEGISREEAWRKAFCDKLLEVGLAGAGGALSGGVLAAPKTTAKGIASTRTRINNKKSAKADIATAAGERTKIDSSAKESTEIEAVPEGDIFKKSEADAITDAPTKDILPSEKPDPDPKPMYKIIEDAKKKPKHTTIHNLALEIEKKGASVTSADTQKLDTLNDAWNDVAYAADGGNNSFEKVEEIIRMKYTPEDIPYNELKDAYEAAVGANNDVALTENTADNDIAAVDKIKNAIPELSEMENVTSITGNEFEGSDASVADRVIDFFSTHNNKIKRKDFGSISIGQYVLKLALPTGVDARSASIFAAVPDIIANGKQIDYQNAPLSGSYTFAAPVDIGGETRYVSVNVNETTTENVYSLREVADSEGNVFKLYDDSDFSLAFAPVESDTQANGAIDFSDNAPSFDNDSSFESSGSGDDIIQFAPVEKSPSAGENNRTSRGDGSADLDAPAENEITKHIAEIEEENRWHEPRDSAVSKFYADESTFEKRLKAWGDYDTHPIRNARTETARSGYVYGAAESDIAIAERLSKALGRDILFFSEDSRNDNIKNGVFDRDTIWINVKHDSEKTIPWIIAHELTHTIEATKAYDALKDYVFDILGEEAVNKQRKELLEMYDRNEIDYEIVSNYVADHLLTDEAAIMKLVRKNRSLGQKIKSILANILEKIGIGGKKTEEYLALERVYKTYQRALAEQANAQSTDGAASEVERAKEKAIDPDDILKDDYIKDLREQFTRGEITQAEFNRLVDEYVDGGSTTNDKPKFSLSKDINGETFVDVTEDIFDVNNGESVARTIQRILHDRFNNLVDIHGQKIQVNKTTNDEFRRSNSANHFLNNPSQAYNDKLRTIANADEILTAAKRWIGEKIKHDRKDDIVEFARGNVMYRVGKNGYIADVIVGTRKNGAAVLYDLVNIYEKEITEAPVTMASDENSQRRQNTSVDKIISQEKTGVNTSGKNNFPFSKKAQKSVSKITYDNEGRKLSPEQSDYFKNSKVVDEKGNLLAVKHGTNEDFHIFDFSKIGKNGKAEGYGFYFSDDSEITSRYGTIQKEVYVNITKPLSKTKKTITRNGLAKLINSVIDFDIAQYDDEGLTWQDSFISNYVNTYERAKSRQTAVKEFIDQIWDYNDNDVDLIYEIANGDGKTYSTESMREFYDILTDALGYDGIIAEWSHKDGSSKVYVTFNPEQSKYITNKVPTSNRDMRYSYSKFSSDTLTEFADKTRSEYLEVTENLNAKSREYLERREREFVRRIGNILHLSPDTKRGIVKDIARGIVAEQIKNGAVTEDVAKELFEYAYAEGTVKDDEYYNQYKDLKNYLRNTAITISKQDRSDIGDWKAFRQSARGKLKLWHKNGLPVDSAYMELMERYPEQFPAEITHPADQLQKMLEVANGIKVNEISLDEHFGENAEEAKDWMWNDFNQAVTDFTREIGFGKKYIENLAARMAQEGIVVPDAKTLFETYKNLKKLRADATKAVARNVLTSVEENYVRDLLVGRLTLDQVPSEHYNIKGIKDVYEAKLPYEYASKVIEAYHNKRKSDQYARADVLLEGYEDWKAKKSGLALSTNTMERNFYDMIKDTDRAKDMIDEYIAPIHKREAQSTRYKNKFLDKIRALKISQKVAKGNRDTEAAAVQFIGEAESHIMRLESNKYLGKSGGMTLEEWQSELSNFKIKNPNLDYKKIGECVRVFREIYNQLFDDMNKARMLNGYEPIDYRYAYFPHFHKDIPNGFLGKFAEVLGVPQDTQNLPATIAGMTENFKPGIRWLSSAQQRTMSDTEYDCLEGFDRYIGGAADVIFHTEDIQKLRSLANRIRYQASDDATKARMMEVEADNDLSDEEKHEKIAKIAESKFTLSTFVNELDEYTNLLAGKKSRADRVHEQDLGRNFYNWAAWFKKRFGANMVAGNIGSAMTNFIPVAQAAGITKHQMLKAMYAQIKSMAKDDGFADRSDFLTNRIVGTDALSKKTSDKISDLLGTPMELIDGFSSGTIVRALYAQAKKNGLSDAEAMAQANTRAAEVMADRSKGAMPTIFSRSNFLAGIMTQFQLEVANQYNYMFKDLPRYYSGDKRKMLKMLASLFKIFLLSYLFNDVYEALVGRRAAFDPIDIVNNAIGDATGYQLPNMFDAVGDILDGEDLADVFKTEKKGVAEAVKSTVVGAAEELPFVGGLLGGGRIPIRSAMPDIGKLYDTFASDASAKKKMSTIVDELGSLLYILPPFGGGQLRKTLYAIPSIAQGGSYTYDNEGNRRLQYPTHTGNTGSDALEAGRSLIFGKSSSRYAREWVEDGFKTLSAAQTREYEKLIKAGYPKANAIETAKEISKLSEADRTAYDILVGEGFDVDNALDTVNEYKSTAKNASNAYRRENGLTGNSVYKKDKLDALRSLDISEGAKLKLYRKLLADDGFAQEYTDFKAEGLDLDDYLAAESKYNELKRNESATAADNALFLSRWANAQGYNDDQSKLIKETFKFFSFAPVSASSYDDLVSAGLDDKTAYSLLQAFDKLEPINGKNSVSNIQKAGAVIEKVDDKDMQMKVLEGIVSKSTYEDMSFAYSEWYVPPYQFVEAETAIDAVMFEQGKTSESQAIIEEALRRCEMYDGRRAALWQIITKSKKPENNPFDPKIGIQVYKDMQNAN